MKNYCRRFLNKCFQQQNYAQFNLETRAVFSAGDFIGGTARTDDFAGAAIADEQPWTVELTEMKLAQAEQTQSGPYQEITVHLRLTPPAGSDPRRFVLNYDVIMHQVFDFDGDGKADLAVFRSGTWYIQPTTAGFTGVNFGASTDTAIPNVFVR